MYLHEECAEMPREITHAFHPQHSLIQRRVYPFSRRPTCSVCRHRITEIVYSCSSPHSCKFHIHVKCAHSMDMMGERSSFTKHPSHPQHDLKLLWKPGRGASIRCDACGVIHPGNSYICTTCQYCINESCAALGPTTNRLLHDHPLSLAYRLPQEYIECGFRCDVCFKRFFPYYWVYHCVICRYVVHINCASTLSPPIRSNNDGDVLALPSNDIAGDVIIGAFVKKLGATVICNDNDLLKGKYKLHNPEHQLRLISVSLHDDEEEEEEEEGENNNDDDDDDDDAELKCGSQIVCDGCTDPISWWSNYISCGECSFFLHLACFKLPAELSCHPLHPEHDHILTLQMCPKVDYVYCRVCWDSTNGLFYGCKAKECNFRIDIKCVSLPGTIKHASHPHHLNRPTSRTIYWGLKCCACSDQAYGPACYACDVCQIIFHSKCALLPAQVSNRRWDKHPLPLTFNAAANHPSDFYCEVCERKMHPRSGMYHCRDCDVSIHPSCLKTVGGRYRNFKFGQRYDVGALHQHPVVHQLTNKLQCNVCGRRKVYGTQGFQCASQNCDFFMCSVTCGAKHKNVIHAID
ncbi:uncharacterized protein LOC125219283 isoform X2 [Salvia hispanica]|nr:uncharacterized protein LOC125219283 isoform X2 [Salvia hispanica]